jgi:hypothetical protein
MKRNTIGGGKLIGLLGLLALVLVSACATYQPGGDDPNEPWVRAAKGAGTLSCGVLVGDLNATELEQSRIATNAALEVLQSDSPSLTNLKAAMDASPVPDRYEHVSALLLQSLREDLGATDALPVDSVGWAAANSFLSACQRALSETA